MSQAYRILLYNSDLRLGLENVNSTKQASFDQGARLLIDSNAFRNCTAKFHMVSKMNAKIA